MRARITFAFVSVLAGALFLAGAFSLFLVRNAASNNAQATVLNQVQALASSTHGTKSASDYEALLPLFSSVAGINQASIVVITKSSTEFSANTEPPLAHLSALTKSQLRSLTAGKSVSGVNNHLAYAAAQLFSVPTGKTTEETVGIILDSRISFSSDNIWYFLLAGGISLLVAGLLAAIITRRVSGHVVAASQIAERIAEGDLASRLDLPDRQYPELAALGKSLNTMAESLEQARHLERQFLLSISHDLRTPLTSIRGYAEAIAEGITDDLPRAAQVLVHESARLERLIGDLLDLARIESHQFSLHLNPIDARSPVTHVAQAQQYRFAAAEVELAVEVPDVPIAMTADPDRLGQIMTNLIDNALKFARSSVILGIVPQEAEVIFLVSDDGPGIDREDLPHVFERLFTSDRHAARAAGTGLGLAIVAELVAAMGGRIELESPINDAGGTRVAVHLPRVPAKANTQGSE